MNDPLPCLYLCSVFSIFPRQSSSLYFYTFIRIANVSEDESLPYQFLAISSRILRETFSYCFPSMVLILSLPFQRSSRLLRCLFFYVFCVLLHVIKEHSLCYFYFLDNLKSNLEHFYSCFLSSLICVLGFGTENRYLSKG